MKQIIKTKYGKIFYKKDDRTVKPLLKAVLFAERRNHSLFGFKPKPFVIDIVYSNKEYDRKTGLSGIKMHRGAYVTKDRKIIMLLPKIHKLEFATGPFFFHEINHIFYLSLVGKYDPVWLGEGMATYLMGTYKFDKKAWKAWFRRCKRPEWFLFYRYRKKAYFKHMDAFYVLSYLVYEYLHRRFGSKKIVRLLKRFAKDPTKDKFDELFYRAFGMGVREVVREIIC